MVGCCIVVVAAGIPGPVAVVLAVEVLVDVVEFVGHFALSAHIY